jgi:hypothetical protein
MFGYDFKRGLAETPNSYQEKNFYYEPIPIIDNLCINGFFQSYKYFDEIKSQLINKYFIPNIEIANALKTYQISNNSLGISVRRGDYLMLQHNHCVLSTDYYQNIINMYFSNNIDQVYIFSDDISWCKTIFGNNVNYVEDSIGTQLFLMTKMKHFIMSNSTFAWWGAYLNQNNGIIVSPDPWFGPSYEDKNTIDLYHPSWIKFNHQIINQYYTLTPDMYE